ncbi:MAG: GIY-YIG nuclease family protein [Arenicella sp.]|nr:GIY-YIG nuclease family protein [Arenicella sp.]
MKWTVYMLRCADNTLYTGITVDIERRVREHNEDNKKAARYTRARRPVTLVYREQCENRSAASGREYHLKQLSAAQKMALINCG